MNEYEMIYELIAVITCRFAVITFIIMRLRLRNEDITMHRLLAQYQLHFLCMINEEDLVSHGIKNYRDI